MVIFHGYVSQLVTTCHNQMANVHNTLASKLLPFPHVRSSKSYVDEDKGREAVTFYQVSRDWCDVWWMPTYLKDL